MAVQLKALEAEIYWRLPKKKKKKEKKKKKKKSSKSVMAPHTSVATSVCHDVKNMLGKSWLRCLPSPLDTLPNCTPTEMPDPVSDSILLQQQARAASLQLPKK